MDRQYKILSSKAGVKCYPMGGTDFTSDECSRVKCYPIGETDFTSDAKSSRTSRRKQSYNFKDLAVRMGQLPLPRKASTKSRFGDLYIQFDDEIGIR